MIRKSGDVEYFPYTARTVPFIQISPDGTYKWTNAAKDKLTMLYQDNVVILAIWPGKWSTDVFEIDGLGLQAAKDALMRAVK